jgi:hypothetical protein
MKILNLELLTLYMNKSQNRAHGVRFFKSYYKMFIEEGLSCIYQNI